MGIKLTPHSLSHRDWTPERSFENLFHKARRREILNLSACADGSKGYQVTEIKVAEFPFFQVTKLAKEDLQKKLHAMAQQQT